MEKKSKKVVAVKADSTPKTLEYISNQIKKGGEAMILEKLNEMQKSLTSVSGKLNQLFENQKILESFIVVTNTNIEELIHSLNGYSEEAVTEEEIWTEPKKDSSSIN